ncbi:DUF4085 domain-containing protein [Paenibacillus sp. TRM 82003]|nr:DUF4085 domain-containing protein [Paenibacillus sp. TRM 82003]
MKYFTKEWYELCQQLSYHSSLEEEARAETRSEDFFQQLYCASLQDWLQLQEEAASLMQGSGVEPFDKEEATKQYRESFHWNQELLKRALPEEIQTQIADVRVFVLQKATRKVIRAVTDFCENNKRIVTEAAENYRTYLQEAKQSMDKDIVSYYRFHDCTVITSIEKDDSITLFLDNSGGFTDIEEVTFEHARILKQDGELAGAWWLYEEVCQADGKYEFHALLQSPDQGLIDFIVSADRATFRR